MMCIFCQIVEGTVPSYKVYEDEHTFAFLDIAPVADGHVLLIPKHHEQFVEELPEEIYAALFDSLKGLVKPIQEAFDAPACNIGINNGPNAGQIIPHVHIHIIPRPKKAGKNLFSSVGRFKPRSKEYFEEIAEKIRKEIKR
jgi:histidine triad (HIT) family protein